MRIVSIAHRTGVVTLQEGGILQIFEVAARCRDEKSTFQDALISENIDINIRRALEPENRHGENTWLFDHLYAMAEGRPKPETKVPDWIAIEISKYWNQSMTKSGKSTKPQPSRSQHKRWLGTYFILGMVIGGIFWLVGRFFGWFY